MPVVWDLGYAQWLATRPVLVTPWARFRYPARMTLTPCPGGIPHDPFTGLVDLTVPVTCDEVFSTEWAVGSSAAEVECPYKWCGWVGMLIRPPLTVQDRWAALCASYGRRWACR